ncbi:hypothetical protein BDQ17DRAFT_1252318, partial [Cyathus striatus]
VYLTAITGYVLKCMVQAVTAFNSFGPDDLRELDDALSHFHQLCDIFILPDVHDHVSLPRQHSLSHYHHSICLFGSPNGLCSSITESKHIKAVKEPWRHSN